MQQLDSKPIQAAQKTDNNYCLGELCLEQLIYLLYIHNKIQEINICFVLPSSKLSKWVCRLSVMKVSVPHCVYTYCMRCKNHRKYQTMKTRALETQIAHHYAE